MLNNIPEIIAKNKIRKQETESEIFFKDKQNTFFKNSFVYSGVNILMKFIQFIREFVVRYILPPDLMGYWNFVNVVQGFIATFDLGCIAGAIRELAIIRVRSNSEEEGRIRSTTLLFNVIQNTTIGLITVVFFLWNKSNYHPFELIAVLTAVLLFISMGFQNAFISFLQGAHAFVPLSKILFFGTLLDAFFFPVGAYFWGVKGLMAIAVVSNILKVWLFTYFSGLIAATIGKFKIYWDVLKRLLTFGFTLRIVDYPNTIFNMVNILWVTKFMSIEALALFSMARGFAYQISEVGTKVGTVYAMRYLDHAGRGTDKKRVAEELKQFLFLQLLVIIPILCWGAGILLPFLVNTTIPKYSDANRTILILLICSFFFVTNSGLTNPWIKDKKLGSRGIANLVGLFAMIFAFVTTWYIFKYRTLNAIAYASLAGYLLYFIYMVIAVGKDIWSNREVAEIVLVVLVAAAWTYILINAGNSYVFKGNFVEDLKSILYSCAWTFVLLMPIPIYGLKKSKILQGWLK